MVDTTFRLVGDELREVGPTGLRLAFVEDQTWRVEGAGPTVAPLWTPASAGAIAWGDASDLSTLFKLSTDTTPNVAVGDPVGKAGVGYPVKQATSSKRPVLGQSGSLFYLDYDGVDDRLASDAFASELAQPNMVAVAVKADVSTADKLFIDGLTATKRTVLTQNGTHWAIWAGTAEINLATHSTAAPKTIIATANGASSTGTVNGVAGATGDAGSYPMDGLTLGSRYTDDVYCFDGKIYAWAVFDTILTGDNLTSLQAWLNSKAGL